MISATVTRTKHLPGGVAGRAAVIAPRLERGLLAVGRWLYDESLKLVPRDTLALANSADVRLEGHGLGTVVVVGYGRYGDVFVGASGHEGGRVVIRIPSEYAVVVHEGWGPGVVSGRSHFLATPLYTGTDTMRTVFDAAF